MKVSEAAHPLFHTVAGSVKAGDDCDKSNGTQYLSLLPHLVAWRKGAVFSLAGTGHHCHHVLQELLLLVAVNASL